ncbi:hypothetical protein [Dactylosporangium fulvum]|uniref:hypothetical protein n=1 Tax=Dactylosporangium fulvum TaxID=53359 RepID=UPI003872DD3C
MSVSRWRRAFNAGGVQALASKGPGGATCKFTDAQLDELQAVLDAGPAAVRTSAGPWPASLPTG